MAGAMVVPFPAMWWRARTALPGSRTSPSLDATMGRSRDCSGRVAGQPATRPEQSLDRPIVASNDGLVRLPGRAVRARHHIAGKGTTMAPAIRTVGLVKDYGKVRALDGLDLAVESGQVFGFLGPNGAGKSTTIRLLLDLLRPTAGTVEVLGQSPREGGPALRARIGYLPGE